LTSSTRTFFDKKSLGVVGLSCLASESDAFSTTHTIRVALPTVLEDFFDLPLRRNFVLLARFRSAASTTFTRRKKGEVGEETGMERSDEFMAYECLYDTWRSILSFRVARYTTHFGAGITIAGTVVICVD
jgi:hypothetical protein